MSFSLQSIPFLGAFVQQLCAIKATYLPFFSQNVLAGVLGAGIAMIIFSNQKLAGIILIIAWFILSRCV